MKLNHKSSPRNLEVSKKQENWHLPQFFNPEWLLSSNPAIYLSFMNPQKLTFLIYLLGREKVYGRNDMYRAAMGNDFDRSDRTISRWAKALEDEGFIERWRHQNDSNSYVINPHLYTNYAWHRALSKLCDWMPKLVLSLSLLQSGSGTDFVKPYNILRSSPEKNIQKRDDCMTLDQRESVEGQALTHFPEAKARKCRSIALALIRRGDPVTNAGALDLLGFNDAVLDSAISRMKTAQNISKPTRYFMSVCVNLTKDLGLSQDLALVAKCKELGLWLISPEEEKAAAEKALAKKVAASMSDDDINNWSTVIEKVGVEQEKQSPLDLQAQIAKWEVAIDRHLPVLGSDPLGLIKTAEAKVSALKLEQATSLGTAMLGYKPGSTKKKERMIKGDVLSLFLKTFDVSDTSSLDTPPTHATLSANKEFEYGNYQEAEPPFDPIEEDGFTTEVEYN